MGGEDAEADEGAAAEGGVAEEPVELDPEVVACVEAACAALDEAARLLEEAGLRSAVPLLYLHQTVDGFQKRAGGAASIQRLLSAGGADGRSIAQAFADVCQSLCLGLRLAWDGAAASAAAAVQVAQVSLGHLEHKLMTVFGWLEAVRRATDKEAGLGAAWAAASQERCPEDLISSGDFAAFWRDHFPGRFRVRAADFVAALRTARGLSASTSAELLSWLFVRKGSEVGTDGTEAEEVSLVDSALVFDCFGVASGIAFCTHWQELFGHRYITALCGEGEQGRRSTMCAADIALARREQLSTVLLPGWSRERLHGCRSLLRVLATLGLAMACDCEDGLLVEFSEPEVAACLLQPGGPAKLAAAAASPMQGEGLGDLQFSAVTGDLPTKRMQASLLGGRQEREGSAPEGVSALLSEGGSPSPDMAGGTGVRVVGGSDRGLYSTLTALKTSRLWVLNDFLSVFEALDARRRAAAEERVRFADPEATSEAVLQLQQAVREQKGREEQVQRRKQQLLAMEQACDDPDQVGHIKVLMQEVEEAEAELEETKAWLRKQSDIWVSEDVSFQQARQRQDLACRQRVAAILLELKLRHQHRLGVRAELTRIENMLLDLEGFGSSRDKLHEYDLRLAEAIQDRESLLAGLMQATSAVRGHIQEADSNTTERARELEALQRIMEMQAKKSQYLEEIDALERKLGALTSKSPAAAAAAIHAAAAA